MRLPSAPDERRRRMIDIRGLLVVALIGLVVITAAGCGDASRATAVPPPAVVRVEPVVERDVPISVEYVGTLVGYINAQIRARVAGHLERQNYTEGSLVKAGDLLFQGDPRPVQTAPGPAHAKLHPAESPSSQAQAPASARQAQREQTLVGYINAQIRARVAGHLVSQNYTEGSFVKAGDLLFQVDPRPFQTAADQADAKLHLAESQLSQAKAQVSASQAQVEQAIAKVAQDEAQVKRAEATQRQTELDVNRYTPLAQRGSVSQQELDNAVQSNLANLAGVAAARAAVQNSEARVSQARAALERGD